MATKRSAPPAPAANPNSLTGPKPLRAPHYGGDTFDGEVEAFAVTQQGLLVRTKEGVVYGYGFHSGLAHNPRGGDRTRRAYAKIAGLKAADVIAACRAERKRWDDAHAARRIAQARAYLTAKGYKVTLPRKAKGA